MSIKKHMLELTSLQLSHAIVAVQHYMTHLNRKAEEEPEGGEHEDYLVAQSVLSELMRAKQSDAPPVP